MISTAINMVFQNFNPRTREGYDNKKFRSERTLSSDFNPRTHEGYDINQTRLSEIDTILIPVPTEGTMIAASRSSTGM